MQKKVSRSEVLALLQRYQGGCRDRSAYHEKYVEIQDESLQFVASLNGGERSLVHTVAGELGLYHWSSGQGDNRRISVSIDPPEEEEICKRDTVKPQRLFRIPVNTRRYRDDVPPPGHPFAARIHHLIRTAPMSYESALKDALQEKTEKEIKQREVRLVTTIEELIIMRDELRAVDEIAVDLEANQERSYDGICCLLQIGTRQLDYIVDAIALHDDIGPYLNAPIFANEAILKVFHACEGLDIPSLHRDFGCYVLNCFDTQLAAACLCGRDLSLINCYRAFGVVSSAVLDRHAELKSIYQRCDWLARPLSENHLDYARLDVACLLDLKDAIIKALSSPGKYDLLQDQEDGAFFLYQEEDIEDEDCCEDEVIEWTQSSAPTDEEADALRHAWCRSQRACLRLWRPRPRPEPKVARQDRAFKRLKSRLTHREAACFYALFAWRDDMARHLDESIRTVCSSEALMAFARHLPTDINQLRRAFYPLPSAVREDIGNVLSIIRRVAFCEEKIHQATHFRNNEELGALLSWYALLKET